MAIMLRCAGALAITLLLSACLVTPGKFESSLDIRADRSFSFAYKGEIIASDIGKDALPSTDTEDDTDSQDESMESGASLMQIALKKKQKPSPGEENFSQEDKSDPVQMQAIATALTKEKGFRSARYMGDGKFDIDYAISGRLTHAFLFPFNVDAQIVFPFIAVELRGDDRVRVKAPGFSTGFDKSQSQMSGDDTASKALDGTFTLTTDAEIISQNQEEGAETTPQGRKIVWRITPMTADAPVATLRLKP